jgi:hypothetical protein
MTNLSRLYTRIATVAAGASVAAMPFYAKAVEVGSLRPSGSGDDFTAANADQQIRDISGSIIDTVLLIAGILAVIYLIYSGVQYITSSGNTEKTKSARQGIINAVIGIVVITAAFFIVRFAVGAGTQVADLNR